MSLPVEKPEACSTRIGMGVLSGAAAGTFLGAVASNWGDIPLVLKNRPLPALLRTGGVMINYGATMALLGLTYSTVDVRWGKGGAVGDWLHGAALAGMPTDGLQPQG